MAEAIETQQAAAELLAGFQARMLKTAKDRRTFGWLKTNLSALEEQWKEFHTGHLHLPRDAKIKETSYILDDVYGNTQGYYLEVKNMILNALQPGRGQSTVEADADFEDVTHETRQRTKLPTIDLPKFSAHMQSITSCPPVARKTEAEINRVITVMLEAKRGLENLECPVQHWDAWLIYHTVQKLDSATREEWEMYLGDDATMPTFDKLIKFLNTYARALETAHANEGLSKSHSVPSSFKPNARAKSSKTTQAHVASAEPSDKAKRSKFRTCLYCKDQHNISSCERYRNLSVPQRRNFVSSNSLCENCLKPKHTAAECRAPGRCFACGDAHHTSLHGNESENTGSRLEGKKEPPQGAAVAGAQSMPSTVNSHHTNPASRIRNASQQILLATALIELQNENGQSILVRALLDQGSEFSFVTEEVAQCLSLKKTKVNVSVLGIGSATPGSVNAVVTAQLRSSYRADVNLPLRALVMRKLTEQIPAERITRTSWPHLQGLQLADPSYGAPGKIGYIIGAELYGQLLTGKIRRGNSNEPVAQETLLGWILSGPTDITTATYLSQETVYTHHVAAHQELLTALQTFWQVEEPPIQTFESPEDANCEQFFTSTTRRNNEGRFIVRLPLKEQTPDLGDSKSVAVAQWLHTEAKLKRHPLQAKLYHNFLKEYKSLGHMELVDEDDLPVSRKYYLPHHCVIKKKEDFDEPKARVVFNASQPTTNGKSLNHILWAGPKLQGDIWVVLILWRLWKVVFTADIVKMFRQILVDLADTSLQLIIWRESSDQELQTHRLLTVTYGTSPAPYLSNRVLKELVQLYTNKYPIRARIVQRNKYVDEFYAGGDTLEEALEAKNELTMLLTEGQFPLSKWSSNCPELLGKDTAGPETEEKQIKTEDCVWALGTAWLPAQDCFTIRVRPVKLSNVWIKRAVLSEIAKLFDPLGWLGPVVIRAKALMQDLWLTGIGWDDPLPPNLSERWEQFCKELPELSTITIPRWLGSTKTSTLQLHAFSDASERAYAACVYLVVSNGDQKTSNLVIGKTKVAPIKTLSIPRLELCGAHLVARLVTAVRDQLQHPAELFCWTDSKVVIGWLSSHPTRWNTFVATRSGEIATLLPDVKWQHVASRDNPADLASRGASAAELRDSRLWWSGPSWLVNGDRPLAADEIPHDEIPERRSSKGTALVSQSTDEEYLLRFSIYTKLIRVTAYCLRFARNCKHDKSRARTLYLNSRELNAARNTLIARIQEAYFPAEVKALKTSIAIPRASPLLPLRPFIDDKGLLRVAGRLARSTLPYAEKYPIILPKSSAFTRLLINHAHLQTLHGGRQLTLSFLLRSFWILQAGGIVRSVVKDCVRCARINARPETQLMGSLPPFRVEEARPFLRSGVDYAGPIDIRTSKGRGQRSHKGYICIFVCLSVKAVHIEIASDLTTDTFLAAYTRFTRRRGHCAELLSDNGTNFHGADAVLRRLFKEASTFNEVGHHLENEGTTWKYIPPGAPHFGGLWEAAVKSTKTHLRKVIGDATLTYEELSTLTTQVEACLNSRPLFVPSSDGKDAPPMTPAHYLIGTALVAPPEPYDEAEGHMNPVNRWVLISKMRNQFWRSWRQDYLHSLQQRSKWRKARTNVAVGDVVLLANENTPPTKWALGRIVETFPGSDGLVRVVVVKTANSTLKRPITKICKLPVLNENSPPEEFQEI